MSKRIVQIVTQMEAGGAQSVALLLHRELIARGIDAELWFLYVKTPAFASEPGVRSIWQKRPNAPEILSMICALARQIGQTKPSAVIAHTHYASAIALPVAKACGISKRLAVHHNEISTYPWLARWMEACCKCLAICTESITVSEGVRQSLLNWNTKRYQGTTRCIYNGLSSQMDSKSFPITPDTNVLQAKKVLFNAGRLTEQKNQIALIEALPELPECTAVIAGRGPLEQALRSRAQALGVSARLLLLGEIDPAAVHGWMLRADVFVFPSRFEAMPMALLEAMRSGMTIVASDIPAHRELAGETTVQLTASDPSSLAIAIRSALQQKHSGNTLGRLAHERSLQFTVQAMTDAYLVSL